MQESIIIDRLQRSFALWEDMARGLPEEAFAARLPVASSTIGQQFWCLIGARESYTRAIASGGWQGFACSLAADEITSRAAILRALQNSAAGFQRCMTELASENDNVNTGSAAENDNLRDGLLLDLMEHEAQHMGQLIRYCYGLGYSFPPGWQQRWALS